MRTDEELRELHKNLDTAADMTKKRFEWVGHVVRMGIRIDKGSTVKKIFVSKLKGSRRRGRPRLRWIEDIEKSLREMRVKRWRQKEVDRENGRL
jgi:hypothetical protein